MLIISKKICSHVSMSKKYNLKEMCNSMEYVIMWHFFGIEYLCYLFNIQDLGRENKIDFFSPHLFIKKSFSPFIFISWRLITLQYYSGFCHTLTWISHGFTCIPHPDPPSHFPLSPIPLGLPLQCFSARSWLFQNFRGWAVYKPCYLSLFWRLESKIRVPAWLSEWGPLSGPISE